MSVIPEDSDLSAPKPPVPSPLPAPTPVAPIAPLTTPPVSTAAVPGKSTLKLPTPPSGGLRPPVSPPPAALNKLPESPKFVSPMPAIEHADDAIPAFLPIVAGFAAAAAIAFAVLLYLKR